MEILCLVVNAVPKCRYNAQAVIDRRRPVCMTSPSPQMQLLAFSRVTLLFATDFWFISSFFLTYLRNWWNKKVCGWFVRCYSICQHFRVHTAGRIKIINKRTRMDNSKCCVRYTTQMLAIVQHRILCPCRHVMHNQLEADGEGVSILQIRTFFLYCRCRRLLCNLNWALNIIWFSAVAFLF